MNKGLIAGLALCVGIGAMTGGVCGYFLNKTDFKMPTNNENVAVEISKEVYDFPEGFPNSYSIKKINNEISLFYSSESNVTFLFNNETNKFVQVMSSSLASVTNSAMLIGSNLFLIGEDYSINVFSMITNKITVLSYSRAQSFAKILSYDENNVYLRLSTSSGNEIVSVNRASLSFTLICIIDNYYIDTIVDYDDYCFLYATYDLSFSVPKGLYILNKSTNEITSFSSECVNGKSMYRNGKFLYYVCERSYYKVIDLDSMEVSTLYSKSYGFENSYEEDPYYVLNDGLWLGNDYYISFNDNSFHAFSKITSVFSCEDKFFVCRLIDVTSSTGRPVISTFDEETKTFTDVYLGEVTYAYYSYSFITFNGRAYLNCGRTNSNTAAYSVLEISQDENGDFVFSALSLKNKIVDDNIKLSPTAYIFKQSDRIYFYDFLTNEYKFLGSFSIVDYELKDNVLSFYASNSYKYEFSLNNRLLAKVGYYEN